MLLCGDDITARRAYEVGLINRVVPDGEAVARRSRVGRSDRGKRPLAVRALVATLRETESLPESEAFEIEQRHGGAVIGSEDRRGSACLPREAATGVHGEIGVGDPSSPVAVAPGGRAGLVSIRSGMGTGQQGGVPSVAAAAAEAALGGVRRVSLADQPNVRFDFVGRARARVDPAPAGGPTGAAQLQDVGFDIGWPF